MKKKNEAQIKIKEKKLEIKQRNTERKIEAHINLANVRIEEAVDDADLELLY